MVINRRDFLRSGIIVGSGVLSNFYFTPDAQSAGSSQEIFAAARRHKTQTMDTSYSVALFNKQGDLRSVALPGRGHDIAIRPQQTGSEIEVVALARRPGLFAVAFSTNSAKQPLHFFAREDRHFYGHGVFSPDGKLLFTTENDFEKGLGVIGVRDATNNYNQIGELSSFGIGPHDMALLDDGTTLVIANGGLETTPETGRQILNLPEMEPSLVYVDSRTGALIEKQTLPKELHQLSIRHLTVASKNRVVFGGQFKGPKTTTPQLIGIHDRGKMIKLIETPKDVLLSMKNYVGSVTVDQSGEIIAASHPRGGLITYWDAIGQRYLGSKVLKDGCGVARTHSNREFLLTSGTGHVEQATMNFQKLQRHEEVQWDNHAILVR